MVTTPRHIAVVALRRSGTTALWNLLRRDDRYTCFDEPFSHLFHDLPAENAKRTRAEFIGLYNRDPARFRELYAPITRGEEVTRGLTEKQVAYLKHLLEGGPTAFDVTRCMGKIPALHEVAPEGVLVHLYRHPVAFASSHLLPSDSFDPLGLRGRWKRKTALTRSGGFNGWGMEELLRTDWLDRTNELLAEVEVAIPAADKRVPAARRLLGMWLGAFRLAEREGRQLYGERFLSLPFEDFCAAPQDALTAIQELAESEPTKFDTSYLRPASSGLDVENPAWPAMARDAGFDADEMTRFFGAGATA